MARGSIALELIPSGSVSQTKNPPAGRVQWHSGGIIRDSALSMASRRSR